MVWVAKPPKRMTADEYFIHVVQLVSLRYNVEVTINTSKRFVEFHTNDEMLIRTIHEEIEEAIENAEL
jgi:hypothetical protein